VTNFIQRAFRAGERGLAYLQGKGYGSKSVAKEIDSAHSFLRNVKVRQCIDVGGNVGNYTAGLIERFPNSMIDVFEPSKSNIDTLNSRFELNRNVRIHGEAVSDTRGMATLFSNEPGSVLGSLTKRRLDHFNIKFDTLEQVQTIRFEEFWKEELKSKRIDLVKLDIEGHELSALKGFGDAINNVSVIQFEFGGCNIDTRTCFQDFWYFFSENGFELHRITPFGVYHLPRYSEAYEFFSTTNYIAVSGESAALGKE
jgi:FkbM family methyltransferase